MKNFTISVKPQNTKAVSEKKNECQKPLPIKLSKLSKFKQVREKNIFFILSSGRSGTKTMAESLSKLPDCLCLHEPAPQLILESSAYRYGRLDGNTLKEFLIKTRNPVIKGKIYGESNQTLSLIVPVLTTSFPDGKFIWLIRNGLDVVSSIFARKWYTGHSANHDRYEDCPSLEKAWIDGRIMGDLCGDVSSTKWKSMNPFARCCWYWAYINLAIERDLRDHCSIGNYKKIKLEELNNELPKLTEWLGFGYSSDPKIGMHNRAHYQLYPWQKWTSEERKTFIYWCGPLMDRLYPDWRSVNRGFFNDGYNTHASLKFLDKKDLKNQNNLHEDNSLSTNLENLKIYFTPQVKAYPKISVYIPSYNQKEYLVEAIESVLAQTLMPHQIIIVDDFSIDGSREIIAKYANKYSSFIFPIYHTQNLGVVRTRLDALKAVTGDYVTYVDGDDRFLPEKLECEFDILIQNPNAQIVYSNNYYISPNGQRTGIWAEQEKPPQGYIFKETFGRIFPQSSLFRMELVNYQAWKSVGFHDPEITIYEDFDMRIRMTKHFQVAFCDKPLSEIRLHGTELSSLKAKQHLASLEFIYHKNRSLLEDLNKSDREKVKKGFFDFVNNISITAANQLAEDQRTRKHNSDKISHEKIRIISKDRQPNKLNELGANLIFLISQPRAGSTLFQRLLAGHPEIHTTAEPWIMLHPIYALKNKGIATEYRADLALQGLDDFLMQVPEGIELYKNALRKFGSTLYDRQLEMSGKRFFLDKTPRYYHIIPELFSVFPEANFIFLLRNPVAVLSSVLKTWFGNSVDNLQIQNLIDLVKGPVCLLDGIKKLRENAIVVEYESLAKYPEAVMLRVCNRIGIPYFGNMIEYGRNPKPKGKFGDPVGVYKHNNPVTDNINKWQKNISSPEFVEISNQYLETLGADIVSKMGYNFRELKQKLSIQSRFFNPEELKKSQLPVERDRLGPEESKTASKEYAISAIVSTYNSERFIRGCLEHLENQTIADRLEIIVVNSGSEQSEDKIIKEFQKENSNIKYIRTENRETVYQAWNRGIRYARGKYIINANTDDRFAFDALERMADELDADSGIQAVYGNWLVTDVENDSFESNTKKFSFSYPEFFPPLFFYYQITSHACLLRKEIFSHIGTFDPRLKVFGDREFMLRFSKAGFKARKLPINAGLYLKNQKGLEHSYPGSGAEFLSIRDIYIQPQFIASLFGYETTPNDKKLAELYAVTGSLGKEFYTLDEQSVSDFNFAARLFSEALDLDPANAMALNNLGIIMCLKGKPQDGIRQFEKAIECEGVDAKRQIRENLQAAKQGGNLLENYWWYPYEILEQMVLVKKSKKFEDLRQRPDNTHSAFLKEFALPGPSVNHPMVSVIVPTYNRPEMLRVALESLTVQTFKDFEVIVINDGGTCVDSVIGDFNKRLNIQFIDYPENCNRAAARNRGIRIADGKYIAYLDDDDRFYPAHLETLVSFLETNDCQMAYSDAYRAFEEKRKGKYVVMKRDLPHSAEFDNELLLVRNFIPSLCVMHAKACLEAVGFFDESLGTHEDWDLWIRLSHKFKVAHLKKITGEYSWRTDGSSTTSGCRGDFLQTMKTVYNKHKELAAGNTAILEMQKKSFESLKNELSITRKSIECSIIIPVFNKLKYTKKCIDSLYKSSSLRSFELIVVDNNSSDGTREFLASRQDNITIITNTNNQGFAKACNQGARAAIGQYVIFLNNDTEVQPGWLDEFVKCCRQNHRIGAVGAKLLYADNTIQHAGVAIKNSPHPIFPYHIHRGKQADSPEVNKVLEYQAVTGACMLVRRKVFEQIGGFDEEFLNGYEDIDLCFRIGEAGYNVVYCPTSVVYHYESVSSGRFAHANHNIKRLHQKWQNKIVPDEDVPEIHGTDKLSSIVILTHNQIEYTKKCLESIYQHTPELFELIIVDNGSTDGTAAYLESRVIGRQVGVEVKVIKNCGNRGFSAGNNQGIEAACGDYILLMNNDVVVTPGWLDRLIDCTKRNPGAGIVGPMSNNVSGPQLVKTVDYDLRTLEGLKRYSGRFAEQNSGNARRLMRVVGFCMLIKRAVIDKIGGLDTSYGLGNFEDDDFSLRAALAGFKSWMAQDCFIHHFGHRTFIGANIDFNANLTKNWEIFKQKWGFPADLQLGSKYNWAQILKSGFAPEKLYCPINKGNSKERRRKAVSSLLPDADPLKERYQKAQRLINDGRQSEAVTELERLLEMNPNFAIAHNDLGILYYNQGDKEKALNHYEQAVRIEPQNLTFQKNLADFYFVESGRIEDALTIYNKVLEVDFGDVEALLSMGLICAALDRPEDARHFYNRVLEAEPWNADAREQLENLYPN